jgi:hypothetical protein
VETSLKRGESARGCVVVENRSKDALKLTLTTVDVVPPDTPDAGPTFGGTSPFGAGEWITPGVSSLVLPASTMASIPFRIRVPSDADPGSNDGAIIVTALPEGNKAVAIQTGLVAQIGIVVDGTVIRDGQLIERQGPRRVHGGDLATWEATWRNTGTVTDHVNATLTVRNTLTGKVVERTTFDKARVLRGSGRLVRLAWNDVPWIGRYQATLRVKTDGGTKVVRYPATIAIPPTWFLVLAALAISLPLLGWFLRRRRALHEAYVDELVALELAARDGADLDEDEDTDG